jgi:hypothetical protein
MDNTNSIREIPHVKKINNNNLCILSKQKILKEKSPSPLTTNYKGNILVANGDEVKENKAISDVLTLNDVHMVALELKAGNREKGLYIYRLGKLRKGKTKKQRLRVKSIYTEILDFIRKGIFIPMNDDPTIESWVSSYELYQHFSEINPRTLRGYLKELQELKWVRRHGRDYHLNPFLFRLFKIAPYLTSILEFAPYRIDFFELLNLPLVNSLNRAVKKVDMKYFEVKHEKYYREIFCGYLCIRLTLEQGNIAETILPVNRHAQSAKGEDIEHNCVPLVWKLFDIEKASYYSTNYKRSHHKGAKNRHNEFIHFDNSITIRYQPKNKWHLFWERRFHRQKITSIKHWQTGEYLEYDNLDNVERLFVERFISEKRFLDLFNALGMTYKRNTGRPKGGKKKRKQIAFEPKQIDLLAMLT